MNSKCTYCEREFNSLGKPQSGSILSLNKITTKMISHTICVNTATCIIVYHDIRAL